jgi:hypothetical protein
MSTAVAARPARKPAASRRWGERSVVQISIPAANGRMRRPIESPVIRLKLIKKPATLQANNQYHPRPPGWPRRLQPRTAAMSTRSGHARINLNRMLLPYREREALGGRRQATVIVCVGGMIRRGPAS